MRKIAKALMAVLVLLSFTIVAQPTIAVPHEGDSGGIGFARWVNLHNTGISGNASVNMSVPTLITNESAVFFHGNAAKETGASIPIYVNITINGTNAYSGLVTLAANNTTYRVTVEFGADVLSQGNDQPIFIGLRIGDNESRNMDSYWNGTIDVGAQFDVLTSWMITTVVQIVMVMLIISVVIVVFKMFKKFPTAA
jgi:hypothetical protein